MVTGPVSKASIARSGARGAAGFRGHTEHIEKRLGSPHSVMCFYTSGFSTSLVTTHLPVQKASRAITPEGVCVATIELAGFLRALGIKKPKIAVASLNPHAGESELLGKEERASIVPGVERARRRLGRSVAVFGPIGAETAYRVAQAGGYHGVVAMLHDQATIPTKLLAFGEAVNVTLGLPIIRTSVDHGTAYDIAWQRKADPAGMLAAMRLASKLLRALPASRR
jgi:4-hydroxythreonine-4-phosphate dehydrogenase